MGEPSASDRLRASELVEVVNSSPILTPTAASVALRFLIREICLAERHDASR